MRTFTLTLVAAFIIIVAVSSAHAQSKSPKPSASREVFDQLAAKDRELFDTVFNRCDADRLGEMLTDDFEFYHDKWGQTAKSGKEFVDVIKRGCERQKTGVDYRARRELVKGSLKVYPLNNYGAVQMGIHRFYRLTEGKKDVLTETSKFTNLWKKDNGQWKLARVISYDHRDPKGAALADRVGKK